MKTKILYIIAASWISATLHAKEPVKVACVGNSITYGYRLENREKECYPSVLGEMLGEGYEVGNFGINSRTLLYKGDLPYVKEKIFRKALAFRPDIVVIKLGTNDTKPQNWKHAGEFEKDLNAMIDAFSNLETKPKIYLCYPCPFYQLDGRGINEDRIFNGVIPIIRKVARERGLPEIDMHTALSDRPQFFPDKLHPNADGARAMAEAAAKKILEDLKTAKSAK